MDDNIQNCCRICLDVESRHVSILENSTIHLHIKSCLPINISTNDDLPKSICETCVSQLHEFYNFQLNARCSQDWLESSLQEKSKKSTESKPQVQPLPDSEYNSDSLLEFLNNTENIEEYLNNLGKEDIPSIVNMLDRTESSDAIAKTANCKLMKLPSPNKKDSMNKSEAQINMDIDVLDSDIEIVKELMLKKTMPRNHIRSTEMSCFACKMKLDTLNKLSHHLSVCDNALRTCVYCNILFDSKQQMRIHSLSHSVMTPLTCNCGKQFETKEKLIFHCKRCNIDHITSMGFVYSCKQCKATFNERFQLYKHARGHVLKSKERICDICGHIFIGDESLLKHRKEEHEKPDKFEYRCKVCSYTSPDRKKIYSHVQKHMQDKEHRHLCESCGRSFANSSTLQHHSQQHNKTQPKCHKCHMCDKTFADSLVRDKHLLDHIEMVMCDKCGQSVNSYKMDKHVCT